MQTKFIPLEKIETSGGEVLRALRVHEGKKSFVREAYFSSLKPGAIRAWKRHSQMTVNVVVPAGGVTFVVVNESENSFDIFKLGSDHEHGRLIIPKGTWFGFKADKSGGLVLNMADLVHSDEEVETADKVIFDFDWSSIP